MLERGSGIRRTSLRRLFISRDFFYLRGRRETRVRESENVFLPPRVRTRDNFRIGGVGERKIGRRLDMKRRWLRRTIYRTYVLFICSIYMCKCLDLIVI